MKQPKINAYLIRVDEKTEKNYMGSIEEIPNELSFLQRFVNFNREGGTIQVVSIQDIHVICHDEGKLLNYPISRIYIDGDKVLDVFAGNLICVRADISTGDFTSILESDLPVIRKYLKAFFRTPAGKIIVIPSDVWLDEWRPDEN